MLVSLHHIKNPITIKLEHQLRGNVTKIITFAFDSFESIY